MRRASKPHSKSNSRCCDNIATAEGVIDAFLAGDNEALLALIDDETILDVVDQTGIIPYAGIYRGPAGVAEFLGTLASLTVSQQRSRGLTLSDECDDAVLVTILGTTTLRCSPNSAVSQAFPNTLYVLFKFRCCRLKHISITQDTGPQVLFFQNCPLAS